MIEDDQIASMKVWNLIKITYNDSEAAVIVVMI